MDPRYNNRRDRKGKYFTLRKEERRIALAAYYRGESLLRLIMMKWEEVRKICPNSFVLLQILESHIEGDKKLIDDVAVIRAIDDSKEATRELVNAKPGTLVYHTAKDKIEVLIRKSVGFRGAM